MIQRHTLRSPDESAAYVAKLRAEGLLPPRGKSAEYVPKEYNNVIQQQPAKLCQSLGEIVHLEPCTCGASNKIEVLECLNLENQRKSGASGRCVRSKYDLARIKDKDAKASLLCCETCPLMAECVSAPAQDAPSGDQ